MKRIIALLLTMLSACNAQPTPPPSVSVAGAANCIDLTHVIARHAVAPDAVIFEMAGGISYRAELQGRCAGASRAHGSEIVQTETQSTHLCRDDHIRIYDPVEAKATGAGSFAMCRVAGFTPVRER